MDRLSEEHMEHHSSATLLKVENCFQPSNTNYGNLSHHSAQSVNQDTYDKGNSPHLTPHQMDFLHYFAHHELIATGLLKFDDRPESYRSCKYSFKNSIKGVSPSAREELDLLVKWPGKECVEHAKTTRAVHPNNSEKDLKIVWTRLKECYSSLEIIKETLFKRIDFPKIANRDSSKLREFNDLLMKLQSAKEDGDLPRLVTLDAARGIHPLVQKLPFGLQERWMFWGSEYKDHNRVPFPPFIAFVDFISHQAKVRNDPSFRVTPHNDRVSWQPEKMTISGKQNQSFFHCLHQPK